MTTSIQNHGLNQEERDLLIELKTQMEGVRVDIKELKDNTQARLAVVESGKADRAEIARLQLEADKVHQDQETRIRASEKLLTKIVTWGAAAMLVLGVSEFLLVYLKGS
jgi:oligoendopeptidase F